MYMRALPARLAALLAALAVLGGCKAVVAAPPTASRGQARHHGGTAHHSRSGHRDHGAKRAGALRKAGRGGRSRALIPIADEGRVTYSVRLTHCHAGDGGQLPDPRCTPGSVDPAVTPATIGSTICRSGYTAQVRPPSSETARAKYDITYPAYRIPGDDTSELDHLVSLELGGSNDITNLWPEVGSLPNPKDKVENALHRAVCDGRVSLRAAQRAIASDWMTAEARLGLH